MHADNHQPALLVSFIPRDHVRQRSDAIDAGVVPEIDQHYRLVAQCLEAHRAMLNPLPAIEFRRQYCLGQLWHRDPLDDSERSTGSLSPLSRIDRAAIAR